MNKRWLKEALTAGNNCNGFKLGTALTLGWFWARMTGSRLLYRGRSLEQIDFTKVLAVGDANAKQISAPRWISHEAGSSYYYVIRSVDRSGQQEETYRAAVKVSIDGQGKLAVRQCNNVKAVSGRQETGGKIRLMWYYCPAGQQAEPCCFNIYSDKGSGHADHENPAGKVEYCGDGFYSYHFEQSFAGENLFAIRTADSKGLENVCWAKKRVEFKESKPEGIDILSIEAQ